MKKTIFSVFILLILTSLHSQVKYKINENTYQKINLSFTFENLKSIDVKTAEGFFSRLYIDGCGGSKNIGAPELPVSVNMLEIPIFGDYVLNVYGKEFVMYDANLLGISYPVYPAQPSVSKSYEGAVEFIQNKEVYQIDAFYALPLAQFKEAGMMRNVNLGELYVSPVQYNPVTNEIKVYKSIDVEIIFKKVELAKTQIIRNLHHSPLFYPSNTINTMKSNKAEFSNTPIKYLIVAHEMFRGELDNFIAWKKRKGFLVEVAYTDEDNVGKTTTTIATFIKSRYENATPENPAPTFVLLVGDVQQIPTFNYGHSTDLYYFTWAGGNFPCCYYGRFSAQNISHLTPQIEKTLQYEKFTMPNANYLNNAVLVAGYDNLYAPVYGNGQLNYMANNYVNSENGYANVYKHPHPCTSEAEKIRAEIGTGVGLANYTAHCNASGWYNPPFNTSHIARMINTNKYGLMIGNCCESSKFDVLECFGEALLRAEGKGAVGYIGGSADTYWDEDYYWSIGFRNTITANPTYDPLFLGVYDRLFHTQGEIYNSWITTFGAIITAGNTAVQISTTDMSMKKYYWEIYNLMGDPSIMTYLSKPSQMTITINNVIPFGDSVFYAKVVPYAYCALTDSARELVSVGFADGEGNITLLFEPMEKHTTYEFTAWAQNYVQYFQTVYSGYVGIEELTMNNEQVTIYPNPTNDKLRILVNNEQLIMNNVEVFDVYGRTIPLLWRGQGVVDISHLSAGLYFVVVTTERGRVVGKVVKQ